VLGVGILPLSVPFQILELFQQCGTLKKGRQYNVQGKKDKSTNNDLQNITQKTKDRATRTSLKSAVNAGALEG
jgi:hypothetical protein